MKVTGKNSQVASPAKRANEREAKKLKFKTKAGVDQKDAEML